MPLENVGFHHHDVAKFMHVPGRLEYVLHVAWLASGIDYLKIPIDTLNVGSMGTLNNWNWWRTMTLEFWQIQLRGIWRPCFATNSQTGSYRQGKRIFESKKNVSIPYVKLSFFNPIIRILKWTQDESNNNKPRKIKNPLSIINLNIGCNYSILLMNLLRKNKKELFFVFSN